MLRSRYQLVALRTNNEATFEAACRSVDVDIISMDCSKRLPFRLDRSVVQDAMKRGVLFEICYGAGTRGNKNNNQTISPVAVIFFLH